MGSDMRSYEIECTAYDARVAKDAALDMYRLLSNSQRKKLSSGTKDWIKANCK